MWRQQVLGLLKVLGVLVLVHSGAGLTACSSDPTTEQTVEGRGTVRRSRALAVSGSCVDHCGGPSDGACFCDADCSDYGDCCADKADVCGGTELSGSCAGVCAGQAADGNCFCDHVCSVFGDCCEDKVEQCGAAPARRDSCIGHCGAASESGMCYCDDNCEAMGDCCADKVDACGHSEIPSPDCVEDADCPEGAVCDRDAGECVLLPPPEPTGTCENACGGHAVDGTCWCDSACKSAGDCCSDKVRWCGDADPEVCEGYVCWETETCIPNDWVCDGAIDCATADDERYCSTNECDSSYDCAESFDCVDGYCVPGPCDGYSCFDGSCVPASWECDGMADCANGEDEWMCDPAYCDGFLCDDGECIPAAWECDEELDCADGEDEASCGPACDGFACYDGSCISYDWVCDEFVDCAHGEDEAYCESTCDGLACGDACVPEYWICDGYADCAEGEDEAFCAGYIPCVGDGDCAAGQSCIEGYCAPTADACCSEGNPCDWADDGVCDCEGDYAYSWDFNDCY